MESKKSTASNLVFFELISIFLIITCLLQIPILVLSSIESGVHCDTQDDCGDFMMCVDNECVCDEDTLSTSEVSYFSGSEELLCGREKCDNVTYPCGVNSYCNSEGVCKCSDGYEEEKHSRKCKLPYGSQCASTDACNMDKFLSCIDGLCRCHNGEDSDYDLIKQTCVGRLSKSCDLHAWMGLQLSCGHNAECSKNPPTFQVNPYEGFGICHCSSGFLPNKSQGAYPYSCEPSFGKQCNHTRDCGDYTNVHLICLRNKCACKSGSFYDETSNQCRLLVGSKCKIKDSHSHEGALGDSCVENAVCKNQLESYSSYTIEDGEGLCTCMDGFTMNSNKTCYPVLSHRETCNIHSNISCDSNVGLTCRESICECRDNFEYDFEAGKCIGYSCNLTSTDNLSSCPFSNSECNPDLLLCQCKPGFFQDMKSGKCIQLLGGECNLISSKSLTKSSNIECSLDGQYTLLGLTCLRKNSSDEILGECGCDREKEETVFDEEAGECRLKIGESCSYSSHRRCVTNAFCGTGNKCQCYDGYTTDSEKNCLLSFGEPCGMGRTQGKQKKCNGFAGLICLSGKCDCEQGKEFNSSSLKCQDLKSFPLRIIDVNSSNVDAKNNLDSSTLRAVETPAHISEETSPLLVTKSSNSLLIILILCSSLLGIILATFVAMILSKKYGKFQLLKQCSTDSHRIHIENNYVIST